MRHAALGCLVLFGLILFPSNSIFAQNDSAVSTQTPDKRAFDLAMALVAAGSEEERTKLLVAQPLVVTAELARALNLLGTEKRADGLYAQALHHFTLSLQIAERVGDQKEIMAGLNGV